MSGRAAIVTDVATGERRVGRFGWKSQHATLLAFGADAYRNEMGITNDLFPRESSFGVSEAQMRRCDPIPDPEDIRDPVTRRRGIDNFEAFMKFLAPLARGTIDDTVRNGERVFAAIGCAACHVPSLTTGPSSHPAFHRKPVPLFSDLLLHDVGTGDGIRQGPAEPEEIRTPALWGLRFQTSAAARWQRGHRRGRHPASPERSRPGAARIRGTVAVRSCRARGVPEESLGAAFRRTAIVGRSRLQTDRDRRKGPPSGGP